MVVRRAVHRDGSSGRGKRIGVSVNDLNEPLPLDDGQGEISGRTALDKRKLTEAPKPRQSISRRFPSTLEIRALEIGADELHGRLEWRLRDQPKALRAARKRYRLFCASLLRQLSRGSRNELRKAA